MPIDSSLGSSSVEPARVEDMRQLPRPYILVGFTALLSIGLFIGLRLRGADPRDQYRAQSTQIEGDTAQPHDSRGPEDIALKIAGYPNPDGILPSEILVSFPRQDIAIVTVTSRSLRDDSIAARQVRVELQKHQNTWRVEWAGSRQKCRRDLFGGLQWRTKLCP